MTFSFTCFQDLKITRSNLTEMSVKYSEISANSTCKSASSTVGTVKAQVPKCIMPGVTRSTGKDVSVGIREPFSAGARDCESLTALNGRAQLD